MEHDRYLSILKEILSEMKYMKRSVEIVRAAQVLAETYFDDITHETNLYRVSILLHASLSSVDCSFNELDVLLEREISYYKSCTSKSCSLSDLEVTE